MRGKIIDSIFAQMETNDNLFFLTADMGIGLVEKFEEHYPNRFLNVGIAEQNLVGISAGLVNIGYRPFAYTISNFIIHRCLEQIRNDIGLHNYPITLLGTSTGFDNAPLGPTHHIVDDWGTLKGLPNIDIYCPSSVSYADKLIEKIIKAERPAYIRIPKGTHTHPDSDENMVNIQGKGNEVLLVSYGNPAQNCIEVQRREPKVSVLIINRLRPLDELELSKYLNCYKRIIIVEDHFPHSGLYGSLCEFIATHPIAGKLESLGPRSYSFEVGTTPDFFYKKHGLDVDNILKLIHK
jgi:transketolase